MKHREPVPPRVLEVQTMFEPTRIAPTCLQEAYELLVPLRRRSILPQREEDTHPADIRAAQIRRKTA